LQNQICGSHFKFFGKFITLISECKVVSTWSLHRVTQNALKMAPNVNSSVKTKGT